MSNKFKSLISGIDQISDNLEMKDWLNDKSDERNREHSEHVLREYFGLEDDEPLPTNISDEERIGDGQAV